MDGIQWDMFPNSGKVNFHGYNNHDHDNIGIGETPIPVKAGISIIGKHWGNARKYGTFPRTSLSGIVKVG